MPQFTKGDRVVRTGFSFNGVKQGEVYTVNRQRDNVLYLEGFDQAYTTNRFELANPAAIKPEGAYNPNVGHATDGGGLQQHSIGGPFPFVLVGIENPRGLQPGTYWYVQDKAGQRCTIHFRKCDDAADHAAKLATKYPCGSSASTEPPLRESEGYIPPDITVTLTRQQAEVVAVAVANICVPSNPDVVEDILRTFRTSGVDWKDATKLFARGFDAYGEVRNCEVGTKLLPSGSLTLQRRRKL